MSDLDDRTEYWKTHGGDAALEVFKNDFQSLAYGADVAAAIRRAYPVFFKERHMTALDVGPRTACGTELMARLFHPMSWSKLKIKFTALDVVDRYVEYARLFSPLVEYKIGDLFKLEDKSYDIVIASHVLEHIYDPGPFLTKLRKVARDSVFLAGPYDEHPDVRIPAHVVSMTREFFDITRPDDLDIYESPHWHNGLCFVARYKPW
jgi:2-polyprenyl-3-methyl-5-hydroxy-6-metoxy-1,4-benzoquinol methylase